MSTPRFSVVVPTRDRPETLRHSLRTCLEQQGFDDYEVVVADNCGPPATREVVEACGSPRVRYLRSDAALAMCDNWDRGVAEARGEYVTVLSDDDGLMPYALRELDRLIRETGARAVHWLLGNYIWPNDAFAAEAHNLYFPYTRALTLVDARASLAAAMRFECSAGMLPMLNSAAVHRDLIAQLRQRSRRLFGDCRYPDTYSGFAFAYLLDRYATVTVPMSVLGYSPKSNSLSWRRNAEVAREHTDLSAAAGYRLHPWVPDLVGAAVVAADSFLQAKAVLFPNDEQLVLDRRALAVRALAGVDVTMREEALAKVRASLADRPDLLAWFERQAPQVPSLPPGDAYRLGLPQRGFLGDWLSLSADGFGVADVFGAVQLAARVLGLEGGKVSYDLPPRGQLQQALSAAQQRLADAERQLRQNPFSTSVIVTP
jgi:hypothetical protein